MNDLTEKQQLAVRTALRFMRYRVGAWAPIAKALRLQGDSLEKVVNARCSVTAGVALRVAQFADVTFDDLINGRSLSARVCPHCGHPPDDFQDEETVVTEPEPMLKFTMLDGGPAKKSKDSARSRRYR
jgi:hypothetical protein